MPVPSPAAFLDAVRLAGLLEPDQLAAFSDWFETADPSVQDVARELHRLGWLTPYQIKEVFNQRGRGLTLGPYVLLDLLGEGGMGRVFRARHTALGREVAVKAIRKEKVAKPSTVLRFQQEVRAVAQLSHPNVVLAFDAGEAAGTHFYAMELVDGTDLARLVKDRGPLAVPEACGYVRQAALGLQHAHEAGLVHRDVKPSNLLVAPTGQVKMMDLGLALLRDPVPGAGGPERVTQEGMIVGTPDYLAPEQALDPLGVDVRADVYGLGATLFFLLAGRPPFDGASPTEKLFKHIREPAPSVAAVRPDVPPDLDALVRRMMEKKPADRPPTPQAVAAALAPFAPPGGSYPIPAAVARPSPATPTPHPPLAFPPGVADAAADEFALPTDGVVAKPAYRRKHGRSWVGPAVAGVVLVGLAAGVGLFLLNRKGANPSPPPPLEERFTNLFGMTLVRLPGGAFVMGSPEGEPDRGADEGPAGEVAVPGPFYVAATEITVSQYQKVTGLSPARHARRLRDAAGLPVESVTWDDAAAFCRKLTRLDARRAGWGYRLPTEAEWEYFCRAGTTTPFASGDRAVPGKDGVFAPDELDPAAKAPDTPGKAGQTAANPFGLFDLHGNVAEWCGDFYAPRYPPGPPAGTLRVVRGGSYRDPPGRCRSAARRGLPPTAKDAAVGFRVVFAEMK